MLSPHLPLYTAPYYIETPTVSASVTINPAMSTYNIGVDTTCSSLLNTESVTMPENTASAEMSSQTYIRHSTSSQVGTSEVSKTKLIINPYKTAENDVTVLKTAVTKTVIIDAGMTSESQTTAAERTIRQKNDNTLAYVAGIVSAVLAVLVITVLVLVLTLILRKRRKFISSQPLLGKEC